MFIVRVCLFYSMASEKYPHVNKIFIHGVLVWCEVKDDFRSGHGIIVFAVAPMSQVSYWCAKTFKLSTFKLVDYVRRLAARICGYGVSEVGIGTSEQVDRMVNGAGFALGSTAGSGASVDGGIMGQRLVSTMSWWRLGGLRKVTEGGLVRLSWADGSKERMWKPPLRISLRRWRPG